MKLVMVHAVPMVLYLVVISLIIFSLYSESVSLTCREEQIRQPCSQSSRTDRFNNVQSSMGLSTYLSTLDISTSLKVLVLYLNAFLITPNVLVLIFKYFVKYLYVHT